MSSLRSAWRSSMERSWWEDDAMTMLADGALRQGAMFGRLTPGRPTRRDLATVETMRAERQGEVLALRRQQVTYDQIATRLGISATQVRDDFREAIREIPRQA